VTLCICKCGTQHIISENCIQYHAEMNASRFFTKRKNCIINLTVIRIRYYHGIWEYGFTPPCKHCFKSLCHIQKRRKKKYGNGTTINVRWSITSLTLQLTTFINIQQLQNPRLSKGWAFKLNSFNQITL
jgi:hypothetical protein